MFSRNITKNLNLRLAYYACLRAVYVRPTTVLYVSLAAQSATSSSFHAAVFEKTSGGFISPFSDGLQAERKGYGPVADKGYSTAISSIQSSL